MRPSTGAVGVMLAGLGLALTLAAFIALANWAAAQGTTSNDSDSGGTTTLWEYTVTAVTRNVHLGVWKNNTFHYDGAWYTVTAFTASGDSLSLKFDNPFTADAVADLSLNVGERAFAFSGATLSGAGSTTTLTWALAAPAINAGDTVTLSITAPASPKTVQAPPPTPTPTPTVPAWEPVHTEGVDELHVREAWDLLGLSGAGVKIGVIGGDFHDWHEVACRGELPPTLEIVGISHGSGQWAIESAVSTLDTASCQDCADTSRFCSGHGGKTMEVLHDLAPQAEFAAVQYPSPMSDNLKKDVMEYLATEAFGGVGADIIVDNVDMGDCCLYWHDDLATWVGKMADAGVIFVPGAGNDGDHNYSSAAFVPDSDVGDGGQYHVFARPGTEAEKTGLRIIRPPRSGHNFYVEWDEKPGDPRTEYQVCVALGNYERCEGRGSGSLPFASIHTRHDTIVSSGPGEYEIRVRRVDDGTHPGPRFRLAYYPGYWKPMTPATDEDRDLLRSPGSIEGYEAHPKVLAAGALCQREYKPDTQCPGAGQIAIYSNRGPNFAGDVKPDLVASTTVRTGLFGDYCAEDRTDSHCTFGGTSAAAPHLAGVAALVLEQLRRQQRTGQVKTGADSARVRELLRQNADDLGPPGPDNAYGYGRVNALRAAAAVTRKIRAPANTPAGGTVGPPINSNAPAGVSYALSGPDAANFTIDPTNGQLSLAPGVSLAGANGTTYRITVTAKQGDVQVHLATEVLVPAPGIALPDAEFTVSDAPEHFGTARYSVALETRPSVTVTVAVISDNAAAVTVNPASLTFTDDDWWIPQTVTVAGVADAIDRGVKPRAVITHAASGAGNFPGIGGYKGITGAVAVNLAAGPGFDFSTANVTVTEAAGPGRSASYTVALETEPTHTTFVQITANSGIVSLSPRDLVFTSENWDVPQRVTVTGVGNSVHNQPLGLDRAVITHTARRGGYVDVRGAVTVTLVDDEDATAPGPLLQYTSQTDFYYRSVSFESSNTFTHQGVSNVVDHMRVDFCRPHEVWRYCDLYVEFKGHDTTADVLSDLALVVQGATYGFANAEVRVNTPARYNGIKEKSISYSWRTESGPSYHGAPVRLAIVAMDPGDLPRGLSLPDSRYNAAVKEAGGQVQSYQVHLTSQPTGMVTVTAASSDAALAQVATGSGTFGASATLAFRPDNWNVPQTVTMKTQGGLDDNIDNNGRTITITHTASGANYDGVSGDVTFEVRDDDRLDFTASPSSVAVTEAPGSGRSATYTLQLHSQATGPVTVSLSSGDAALVSVSPATLSFDGSNWDTPQTVTVTYVGADDNVHNEGRSVAITHTGSGANYDGVSRDATVNITNDESPPTVTLRLTPAAIDESGSNNVSTVTATLDRPSSLDTDITIATTPTTGGFTLSSNKILAIVAGSTASTGAVTITAMDNAEAGANRPVTVSGYASNSASFTRPADVTLTITDDETQDVTIPPSLWSYTGETLPFTSYVPIPSSNNTFTHGNKTYTVDSASTYKCGVGSLEGIPSAVTLWFETAFTVDEVADLSLVLDGKTYAFANADVHTIDGNDAYAKVVWETIDAAFATGDTVELAIRPTATGDDAAELAPESAELAIACKPADGVIQKAENSPTVISTFIATGGDGGGITWSLEGADASAFVISKYSANTARLKAASDTGLDYEYQAAHNFTVKVSDGSGGADTVAISLEVTDVDEPPSAPAAPSVGRASSTGFNVQWNAPANSGPAITGYDARYRLANRTPEASWTDLSHQGTATTTAITGLPVIPNDGTDVVNTIKTFEVQVRASNDEGDGPWSPSGLGTQWENRPPHIIRTTAQLLAVTENWQGLFTLSWVPVHEPDGDTVTWSAGGTHASLVSVDPVTGEMSASTENLIDYESLTVGHTGGRQFTYDLIVTDPHGETDRASITYRVFDLPEPPEALELTVTDQTPTGLSLEWTEPATTGPAISGYEVQYREANRTPAADWVAHDHAGTARTTAIGGLTGDTAYEVRVRGVNDEGEGPWAVAQARTLAADPCKVGAGEQTLPWTVSDTVLAECSIGYVAARLIYYFRAEQTGSITIENTTAEGEAWLRLKEAAGFGENRGNLTGRIAVGDSASAEVEADQWYALMLLGSADGQTVTGTVSGSNGLTGIR